MFLVDHLSSLDARRGVMDYPLYTTHENLGSLGNCGKNLPAIVPNLVGDCLNGHQSADY